MYKCKTKTNNIISIYFNTTSHTRSTRIDTSPINNTSI